MPQGDRKQFLRELGYEEPFDESPVEVPDGWHGGEVLNTGGSIMCRIWRTWEPGTRQRDTEFEVIYNPSEHPTVGLEAHTWNDDLGGYVFDHEVESKKAEERDDHAQAELARELMLEHNSST